MGLVNRVKKAGKNVLAGATLASTLLFGTASYAQEQNPESLDAAIQAKEDKRLPSRTLSFDIISAEPLAPGKGANPLDGYDANTKAWYSATQLIGRGSDVTGIKASLDKNLFGRIMQVLALGYLNEAASYYFHEMAHDYAHRRDGHHRQHPPRIDFWDLHRGFPEYIQTGYSFAVKPWNAAFEEDRNVRNMVDGLNQEEFQAGFLFSEQNNKGRVAFDEAISFLTAKTADVVYIAIRNPLVGIRVDEDFDYNALPGSPQGVLANDIDEYLFHLHRKGIYRQYQAGTPIAIWDNNAEGIELTRKQLLTQFIVADALSLRTWESLYAIGHYLATGRRSETPLTIKIGSTEITPPIVNCYMTKNGIFYNSNGLVKIGSMPIELNLGTDIDTWLGPGKVRHLRTGMQSPLWYVDSKGGGVFVKPFVYFNFDRHECKYAGYSAGAEFGLGQRGVFEFSIKAEQNEHDMLENQIKGKEKGFTISAGLKIAY